MDLADVKNSKQFAGRKELTAYLEGKTLTRNQAIKAKCFECMNGYDDGAIDCLIKTCSLYPFMAYKGRALTKAQLKARKE